MEKQEQKPKQNKQLEELCKKGIHTSFDGPVSISNGIGTYFCTNCGRMYQEPASCIDNFENLDNSLDPIAKPMNYSS